MERKNEKKFGDAKLPAPQNRVAKYKLTEEGLTVLAIVGNNNGDDDKEDEGKRVQQQERKSNSMVPDDSKQRSTNNNNKNESFTESFKKRAIAAFKDDVKEENR